MVTDPTGLLPGSYRTTAERRWPAADVHGEGLYALVVTGLGCTTVTLWYWVNDMLDTYLQLAEAVAEQPGAGITMHDLRGPITGMAGAELSPPGSGQSSGAHGAR